MAVDHYENFPVASVLVPADLRPAVVAVYRFARTADDIADEGSAQARERLAQLAQMDEAVQALAGPEGSVADLPRHLQVVADLRPHVLRHGFDLQLFRDLLNAFSQDVSTRRYDTIADVLDYARRSANPVGRLMLQLYGHADTPGKLAASDAICSALQLINFWQDVAVDLEKDRIYLPREDLARFGVVEGALLTNPDRVMPSASWRHLMAFEVDRAQQMLLSGRSLPPQLPWRLSLEIRGVIQGGRRICELLRACEYDVVRRRPALRWRDWCVIGARVVWGFLSGR
jgi:squalene synthase HpnC